MPSLFRSGRALTRVASRVVVSALVAGLVSRASTARAEANEHARAELAYDVPAALGACPDRATFASSVATRLGYEPFAAGERQGATLRVRVRRAGEGLAADLELSRGAGEGAKKTLTSEAGACDELVASSALAAAMMLDPRAMFPRPPPQRAAGPTLDSRAPGTWPWYEPPPLPDRPPSPPPQKEAARVHVGAAAVGCAGCAPGPSAGAAVFAGLSRGAFGVELGARGDLPSAAADASREVRSSLVLGELFPHARLGPLRPGLVGAAGALFGASGDARQVSPWAAAGARLAIEVPVGGAFFVRGALDGLVVLSRVSLRVEGRELWATPPFVAALGLGVGVRL